MNQERPSVFVRLGRLIDGLWRFLIMSSSSAWPPGC